LKVTTKDIAAICGVSIGTVDRALNNRTGISPKTRDKVLAVAKELGYRPHLLARSLVTGCTMTIGVLVGSFNNPFFSELVQVLHQKARQAGYYVYLMLSEYDPEVEMDSLERLRELNVDGVIMCPVNRGRDFAAYMRSLSTPIVTISNRVLQNWTWIGIDDRAAVRDAVAMVISKGYERVIYVTLSRGKDKLKSMYVDERRVQGYRDGVQDASLHSAPMVITDKTMFSMIENHSLLSDERTCVVCSCDALALDVLLLFKNEGISVPEQVGLMGFDNVDELKYITPSLSTVSYPIQQFGESAFESLLAQMNGGAEGESKLLDYEIIQGDTI
jgi:LacI family transcriptional regulator, galactose operon repressor